VEQNAQVDVVTSAEEYLLNFDPPAHEKGFVCENGQLGPSMPRIRTWRVVLFVTAVALLLATCGGDGDQPTLPGRGGAAFPNRSGTQSGARIVSSSSLLLVLGSN